MRIAQLSTIPADAFAGPHLGAILGVVQSGGGLGGAIGPFLGGWLFDVTGSYRLAFLAACVAIAGSAVAAWLAARPTVSTERAVDECNRPTVTPRRDTERASSPD
jgi:MFS family permease